MSQIDPNAAFRPEPMTAATDTELTTLARRLHDRCRAAAVVDYAEAAIEGAWQPDANQCHANTTTWASNNAGWTAVRGWVVFDFSKYPVALFVPRRLIRFMAHSVVRDPAGKLWDITPATTSQPYPFFQHPGTDEEFEDLITRRAITGVDHVLD